MIVESLTLKRSLILFQFAFASNAMTSKEIVRKKQGMILAFQYKNHINFVSKKCCFSDPRLEKTKVCLTCGLKKDDNTKYCLNCGIIV